MNRRDMLKGAVMAIPAVTLVAPTIENGMRDYPRVVWLGLCQPIGPQESEYFPDVDKYARSQIKKGRRVVQIVENSCDLTVVVVEQRCADDAEALTLLNSFNNECADTLLKRGDFEAEFGIVQAITMVGAGQVLDVLAFLKMRDGGRIERLEKRLVKLEAGYRRGGIAKDQTFLVGESGPETFTPHKDGQVLQVIKDNIETIKDALG